jgi:hypothetical protein
MKTLRLVALLAAGLLAVRGHAGAFAHVAPLEIFLAGDFDGDGRADAVIVDRASGVYRIGYGGPGGGTWVPARASGVEDASGAGAGRLFALNRDALAVASEQANRVNLIAANDPAVASLPQNVFTPGIGPSEVAVLNIGGAGNTAHEDLFVATAGLELGGVRRVLVRNNAGTTSILTNQTTVQRLRRANPIRLKVGQPEVVAGFAQSGADESLVVIPVASGAFGAAVSAGVHNDASYAAGFFGGGNLARLLVYRRGQTRLLAQAVLEGPPDVFSISAARTNDVGFRIAQVTVLDSTPVRLLVLGTAAGSAARVYDFDGTNAPVLRQEFAVPAGERYSGAVATDGGGFKLFTSGDVDQPSQRFYSYRFSGGVHSADGSGELPSLNVWGTPANVFLFNEEPFVSLAPRLIASLNAADWSRSATVGGTIDAVAERFGGAAPGLDNPGARALGPRPPLANFALPNQFREAISVASLQPAAGDEVEDVFITPPPGPQVRAIDVTIRSVGNALVVYRDGPLNAWRSASNVAQLRLFRNTTVEYFARPAAGDRKGRVRSARYTFPGPVESQDSDGDGVPDYVEMARGLDPNGGADSDGDGLSDLTELLRGFDPDNRGCTNCPESDIDGRALNEQAAFNLLVSPRPLDGVSGVETGPVSGQAARLHDLYAHLRDESETRVLIPGALFNPSVRFVDAPADVTLQLLTVAMEANFAINTAGTDRQVGRELLGLVPIPELARVPFVFTPPAGSLSSQAAAWINAASNAAASATPTTVLMRLDVPGTLTALLLERRLHDLLAARGALPLGASNRLSLFGFRFADAGRVRPTPQALTELRHLGPGGAPAWNPVTMAGVLSNGVASPVGAALRTLALEVYRRSSLSNNAAPGRFPPPVDVLREFLLSGVLHSNYVSGISGSIAAAAESAVNVLNLPQPRPTNGWVMEVREDSFAPGCTRLYVVSGPSPAGSPFNLFAAPGAPFKFPDAFSLLPGTQVEVAAFTDFSDPCPGDDLEVFAAELVSLPPPEITDTNNNLVPDEWECLFLANGGGPGSDADGDGFSGLQEYLDGSDPRDGLSRGAVAQNVLLGSLALESLPGGGVRVRFPFPAGYAPRFRFQLFAASSLAAGFEVLAATERSAPQELSLEVPSFPSAGGFFYVTQSLRVGVTGR